MPVVGIGVCLSVLAVMNATGGNINFSKLFGQDKALDAAMKEAQSVSKEDTKGMLQQQVASRAKGGQDPEAMAAPAGLPKTAAILIPPKVRRTETVNESATSSQWYKDGSGTKAMGEEVKDKRTVD